MAYSDMHFLDGLTAYFPVILSKNPGVASGWVMAMGPALKWQGKT